MRNLVTHEYSIMLLVPEHSAFHGMLHLLVFTQFLTQNRYALLLELLYATTL